MSVSIEDERARREVEDSRGLSEKKLLQLQTWAAEGKPLYSSRAAFSIIKELRRLRFDVVQKNDMNRRMAEALRRLAEYVVVQPEYDAKSEEGAVDQAIRILDARKAQRK
jgi:hypothetical protein